MVTVSGSHVRGCAIGYRLYDVGYEIDLAQVAARVPAEQLTRFVPSPEVASALSIPRPPLVVHLGAVALGGALAGVPATLSARVYDFGVIAMRLRVGEHAGPRSWDEFSAFGNRVTAALATTTAFHDAIVGLCARLGPAIDRPDLSEVTEDYCVFRLAEWTLADGAPAALDTIPDAALTSLLLQEARPVNAATTRALLPHRFSYYADDLAVLSWEHALVMAPGLEESDVEWVLEFANAQLLELRYYDTRLGEDLPRLYAEIEAARRRGRWLFRRRFGKLLGRLYRVNADTTEVVERAEGALKVTNDVYLARIYGAAMEIFRAREWRADVDRKLGIIRDTYGMLNAEAQAGRSELLEWMIVVLIVAELAMALYRGPG
ncbi:MAG: hypothetical protein HYX65_01310 [Gemmatimonadetes bacterium]|nr:hypothetical protein [Gemmatimonadota bacterium]